MKKILVSSSIVCAMVSISFAAKADSRLSIGADYSISNNEFTGEYLNQKEKVDNDSNAYGINLGLELSNKVFLTFGLQTESFDMGIYDDKNENLNSFYFGVRKEWEINQHVSPYVRGAIGVGMMDINSEFYDDDTAYSVGGKVGLGFGFYPVKQFEILVGADYQYRKFTSIELPEGDLDINDSSVIFSIGASYHF